MSSAQEFKDRYPAPVPILVTVDGLTIECRKPELLSMVYSRLLTWPSLARVREVTQHQQEATVAGTVIDNRPAPSLADRTQATGALIDEWVSLAAVSPRVVMEAHDVTDDSVWVATLPFALRLAVFNATFPAQTTARADFRDDESRGAAPGQGGETVRDEALVAVGDDGSAGGARP